MNATARIAIIVVLILFLVSLLPAWPHSTGLVYSSGGLGALFLVLLILILVGKI